jgi:hypothetical protein
MGLGKTLTMLAAIGKTAEEARLFATVVPKSSELTPCYPISARATLVVVPSPCKPFLFYGENLLTAASTAE